MIPRSLQRRLLKILVQGNLQVKQVGFSALAEPDGLNIFQGEKPTNYDKVLKLVPSKYEKRSERSRRSEQLPRKEVNKGYAVIDCLRPEFNHYKNQKYEENVPLASKGWGHYKSKGDHFTVKLYEKYDLNNYFHGEVSSFSDIQVDKAIVEALKTINIHNPTSIQEKSIPAVLSGKNVLIAAETGCGKTLAFLVPIIQQVIKWNQQITEREYNAPLVLILCPSRELALQIGEVAKSLSHLLPFSCSTILGGHTKKMMLNPHFRNVDIQISTPGVISKLSTVGLYDLRDVKHVVLDEADTMLDDSFNELVSRILKKMKISYVNDPNKIEQNGCQLTLVAATNPTSIYSILENFIEPDSLENISSPKLHKIIPHVPQTFYRLGLTEKPGKLLSLVKTANKNKQPTIVFSNNSKTCDWISLMLHENRVPALNLNGNMPSTLRIGKFKQFKDGEVQVLSCTDVASKGLDTSHVQLVINYDCPRFMADYIHRSGRVGRYNSPKDCRVVTFVTYPYEIELVNKIERAVRTQDALPNVNANIRRIIETHKRRKQ